MSCSRGLPDDHRSASVVAGTLGRHILTMSECSTPKEPVLPGKKSKRPLPKDSEEGVGGGDVLPSRQMRA